MYSLNLAIVIKYTWHKMYHFKQFLNVPLSTSKLLRIHHPHSSPELSYFPQAKLCTSQTLTPPSSLAWGLQITVLPQWMWCSGRLLWLESHLSFCDCFISLCCVLITACIRISFPDWTNGIACICHVLLPTHLLRNTSYFYLLAFANNTAMNMGAQIPSSRICFYLWVHS